MGIVSLLILGVLAGAVAKWLLPGDDPGGVVATMLVGVVIGCFMRVPFSSTAMCIYGVLGAHEPCGARRSG